MPNHITNEVHFSDSRKFAFNILYPGSKPEELGYDENYEYIEDEDE